MVHDSERRSVLLVEDEVLIRLTVADDLRNDGLTVLEAANPDEAGVVLANRSDSIGVVVTDLQMPGTMDGVSFVQFVRRQYPDVRVIVLSGARKEVLASVKADAVFAKPHIPEQLAKQVKQLLGESFDNGSRTSHARNR